VGDNRNWKRHNFFLPEDAVSALKALAAKEQTTYSDLIRKAIKQFLEANGRPSA
jgi:predicted transcriptional regulator